MLTLKGCFRKACSGFRLSDTTRPHDAVNNAGGYGSANNIADPSQFDTYDLKLWLPGTDYYSAPPSVVINLLPLLTTADNEGDYNFDITAEQVGTEEDGVYFWELVGVNSLSEFTSQGFIAVTKDIEKQLRERFPSWKPGCTSCKQGMGGFASLAMELNILQCGYSCDPAGAATIIKHLQHKLKSCC